MADAQRRPSSSTPVGRLGDEDHVDVADVVELAAAALAHADDGQPARRRRLGRRSARAIASAASSAAPARSASSAGRLGQRRRRVGAVEVARGDAEQRAPVGDPQRVVRRPALAAPAAGADGGDERRRGARSRGAARRGSVTARPVLGVADQVVAEGRERPSTASSRSWPGRGGAGRRCSSRTPCWPSSSRRRSASISRTRPSRARSGSAHGAPARRASAVVEDVVERVDQPGQRRVGEQPARRGPASAKPSRASCAGPAASSPARRRSPARPTGARPAHSTRQVAVAARTG